MSILINGMEMPKEGYHHIICVYADGTVATGGREYKAILVPPHGDLIDRDTFVKDLKYDIELDQRALDSMEYIGKDRELLLLDKICKHNSIWYLYQAPAIIPADEMKRGNEYEQ